MSDGHFICLDCSTTSNEVKWCCPSCGGWRYVLSISAVSVVELRAAAQALLDETPSSLVINRRLNEAVTRLRRAIAAEPAESEKPIGAGPPPPPTQGEEETARKEQSWICGNRCGCVGIPCRMAVALRQARDEATRAENDACAVYLEREAAKHNYQADLLAANGDHGEGEAEEMSQHRTDATMLHLHAAAIRARIQPKSEGPLKG